MCICAPEKPINLLYIKEIISEDVYVPRVTVKKYSPAIICSGKRFKMLRRQRLREKVEMSPVNMEIISPPVSCRVLGDTQDGVN